MNTLYMDGNLQSEKSQDYAQKRQRNCTFMNSTSGSEEEWNTNAKQRPSKYQLKTGPRENILIIRNIWLSILHCAFITVWILPIG
jgi:hypothetical protein